MFVLDITMQLDVPVIFIPLELLLLKSEDNMDIPLLLPLICKPIPELLYIFD